MHDVETVCVDSVGGSVERHPSLAVFASLGVGYTMKLKRAALTAVETPLMLGILLRSTSHLLLWGLLQGKQRVPEDMEVEYSLRARLAVRNEPVPPPLDHRIRVGTAAFGMVCIVALAPFIDTAQFTIGQWVGTVLVGLNGSLLVCDPVIGAIHNGKT